MTITISEIITRIFITNPMKIDRYNNKENNKFKLYSLTNKFLF